MVQEINNKATNCTEVKFMQKIFIYRTSPNGWIFPNIAAELTSDTSTLSLLLKLYRTSFNLKKNYMHLEALKYSRILHPENQDSFSVIICTENFEMELNTIKTISPLFDFRKTKFKVSTDRKTILTHNYLYTNGWNTWQSPRCLLISKISKWYM